MFTVMHLSKCQMFNLQKEAVGRRRLTRFKVGHEDNSLCWERHGRDGFLRYSSSKYFLVFLNIFPRFVIVVPQPGGRSQPLPAVLRAAGAVGHVHELAQVPRDPLLHHAGHRSVATVFRVYIISDSG